MITYKLNEVDLSTLGIHVEKVEGLETIPKKKGTTFHDYPDEQGVTPILTPYNSRDITIKCVMTASSYEFGVSYFVSLKNIISGLFTLNISYYPNILNCDCIKEVKATREDSVNGSVTWRFNMVLREYNPSNFIAK